MTWLQDAALLVAMAWMPLVRASNEASRAPDAGFALDLASGPGLTRITVNLVLVLTAIVVLALVVRRSGVGRGAVGDELRIEASLALGPKERLLVVEVAGERVLIGSSAQGLNALHVLASPERTAADVAGPKDARPSRVLALARQGETA